MNNILILSGKSACGKTTMLNELVNKHGYTPIVSATTRPMRNGEVNGVDYDFVSEEWFKHLIEEDDLIEYRTYDTVLNGKNETWYYGIVKKQRNLVDKKYVVILDVDGTKEFCEYYNYNCDVFYLRCDDELRKERIISRGDYCEKEWSRRKQDDDIVFNEEFLMDWVDAVVSTNNNLDDIVGAVLSLQEMFKNLREES